MGIMHADDIAPFEEQMRRLVAGESACERSVTRMRHQLGHWIVVEANASLSCGDATGQPDRIICVIRDVSERVRAEAAMIEANRLLMLAEHVGALGHWRIQLPGRELHWSAEVYRIHGRDPAERVLRRSNAPSRRITRMIVPW